MVQMALTGTQQLKAFPDQNHDAHIAVHMGYMASMIVRANPAIMQILQKHIFEHISLKARLVVQQQAQAQGMQMQPQEIESQVAEVEGDLINEYIELESQIMGMQQKDPLVDLKAQELQLRQQEQAQNAQMDQMELEFDKQKAAEQAAIQRERIDSTEDIAQMRAQIALERTRGRG